MPYSKNVFINCPFDPNYYPLLKSLVFTVLYLDFSPRISQTKSSAKSRIDQIMEHVEASMYGIHDLSRSRAMKKGEFPRFNMPYELGLDIGCSRYGGAKHKDKKIMILEKEPYHYQKVLSDISGQDIFSHNNDPEVLIKRVRDWFSSNDSKALVGPAKIWNAYNQFCAHLFEKLAVEGYKKKEIDSLPISDFIKFANDWIKDFKKQLKKPS
jgi:hypothetical protein